MSTQDLGRRRFAGAVGRAGATLLAVSSLAACDAAQAGNREWTGKVDTLPSGQVVVSNPDRALWGDDEAWRIVEDLRIGSLESAGPDLFGEIAGFDVDPAGRVWVLEGQAQEIRVFDAAGRHVRTVGRKGGGPGEFQGAVHAQFGPDGHLWVMDPQNNRISVIDTAGAFVESHRAPGGFMVRPWPGRWDVNGAYWTPVPDFADGEFRLALVRYRRGSDGGLEMVDSIPAPRDPVERPRFELRSDRGRLVASVPFSPSFRWIVSPQGTLWGIFSGEYRLIEMSVAGDTLRTIRRAFDPLPVTASDRDRAREALDWFTEEGGKIDLSMLPGTKPAGEAFVVDATGRIWVQRITDSHPEGQVMDVFDPAGRYLGRVVLPAPVPALPLVRGDLVYGVARDELEVPYLLRARIVRGPEG